MRIGFDFDNTIVNYDNLFYKVANEQGLLKTSIPVNKLAVRDYLRANQQEEIWTEMQGYVYGKRMDEADIYPDVLDVMLRMKKAGHTLAIVSHKTQYPYLGEKYDLHLAASNWIQSHLCDNHVPLFSSSNLFFELSKEAKLARIANFNCDIFIDDLPEILLAEQFPVKTQAFLFDPEQHHQHITHTNIKRISSWADFANYLL